MTAASGPAATAAARLGLSAGDVVGELGYDEDVDHDFRDAVSDIIDAELLGEDADDVLDAVLLWWRDDGSGDLTDALVDAVTLLAEDGVVWLVSPRTGQNGYIEQSDIVEATRTSGLTQTTTVTGPPGWTLARLARAKQGRPRR